MVCTARHTGPRCCSIAMTRTNCWWQISRDPGAVQAVRAAPSSRRSPQNSTMWCSSNCKSMGTSPRQTCIHAARTASGAKFNTAHSITAHVIIVLFDPFRFPKVRESIGGLTSVPQFVLLDRMDIKYQFEGSQVCDNGELENAIHDMGAGKSGAHQTVEAPQHLRELYLQRQSLFVGCAENHVLLKYKEAQMKDGKNFPVNYALNLNYSAESEQALHCHSCKTFSQTQICCEW
jgi:hypothetical protein